MQIVYSVDARKIRNILSDDSFLPQFFIEFE
jgi:hypothetical protein